MKNCINIVMGTKEITIKILDNATHKEVLESLNKRITELKKQLNQAIDEQNFEKAAQLRDEIREMEG